MITEKECIAIKKIFGTGFPKKIADRLKEKNVCNRHGLAFKPHSVREVLRGVNHSILEDEIRKIWKEKIEEKESLQNELLKRSKHLTT